MKHRDRNPNNRSNWALSCKLCGKAWREDEEVTAAKTHFDKDHGGSKVQLDLKWVGLGTPPKKSPPSPFN